MYRIKSYDTLILHNFERLKSGKYFDDDYQPYTREFLEKMIQYFIQREEYENCAFIKNHIDMRFPHDLGFLNSIKND